MTYQEYCKKVQELTAQKDALYEVASRKYRNGDKDGQTAVYALIDEVQAELDALENPNDKLATDEELTLRLDS